MSIMTGPPRIEYAGALYHVTARGNERKRIYFSKTDYGKFREYIEGAQQKQRGRVFILDGFTKPFTGMRDAAT